jgi:hypothetical protein
MARREGDSPIEDPMGARDLLKGATFFERDIRKSEWAEHKGRRGLSVKLATWRLDLGRQSGGHQQALASLGAFQNPKAAIP